MIRLIITLLFVIVFLICSIPIFLIELILGKINPAAKDKSSLAIVCWAFRVVMFLSGVKATYIGDENIPKNEAVLFVGNHRSYFDIVINYGHIGKLKKLTGFIAKKEVNRVPLLNVWMRFLHCLFLDRSNIKAGLKMILAAIDQVKNGISVFIFPEGTRNKTTEPLIEFHEGSFKIAQKANCAIVPVTINNSRAILEDHFPFIRSTHVIVEYGKPIYIKELAPENQKLVGQYVKGIIADTYQKNMSLI